MSTPILASVLRTLSRLYEFPGSKFAPDTADIDVPIQFVHDLRRDAVMGAAQGVHFGYFVLRTGQTHGGAGTLQDSILLSGPVATGAGYAFDPAFQWCWFMEGWGESSVPANFVDSEIRYEVGTDWIGGADAIVAGAVLSLVAFAGTLGTNLNTLDKVQTARRPSLILSTAPEIVFSSSSSGATVIEQSALVWIGPIGVVPGFLSG